MEKMCECRIIEFCMLHVGTRTKTYEVCCMKAYYAWVEKKSIIFMRPRVNMCEKSPHLCGGIYEASWMRDEMHI